MVRKESLGVEVVSGVLPGALPWRLRSSTGRTLMRRFGQAATAVLRVRGPLPLIWLSSFVGALARGNLAGSPRWDHERLCLLSLNLASSLLLVAWRWERVTAHGGGRGDQFGLGCIGLA